MKKYDFNEIEQQQSSIRWNFDTLITTLLMFEMMSFVVAEFGLIHLGIGDIL